MVTPNALLIASRGFVCKAIAADSSSLAPPAVSVATTVRITLPASAVTVSTHAGEKHCSCWRKRTLTEPAFASYSSTVPPAFSTKVTSVAITISLTAPAGADRSKGASAQPTSPASVDCTPCGHESPRSAHAWQSVKARAPTVRVHARGACTASRHVAAPCPPARTMHACAQLRSWFEPTAGSLQQKPRDRHSAAHHSTASFAFFAAVSSTRRRSSHAHTRRRLESALTTSQVGAGVAPLSCPEFITCAQPVWPGWYVQPESSSKCMLEWV